MQRAARNQTGTHKAFIQNALDARLDRCSRVWQVWHVTTTATLFGGMDESLYADFEGAHAQMNVQQPQAIRH